MSPLKRLLLLSLLIMPVVAAGITMVYIFWYLRQDVVGLLAGIFIVFITPFIGTYLLRGKK